MTQSSTGDSQGLLLSIVVPFHNSVGRCEDILTLASDSEPRCVEYILVDDGSTDNTRELLEAAQSKNPEAVKLVTQDNRGPGGARNAGLDRASGRWVWFADSDDCIDLSCLSVLQETESDQCDFVDFNYRQDEHVRNSMGLEPSVYGSGTVSPEVLLPNESEAGLGRLWSKVFRREFLLKHGVRYPEYCLFEDNYLSYSLPFHIQSFLKSDCIAYEHRVVPGSVTEQAVSGRYFDRLFTSASGYRVGLGLARTPEQRQALRSLFDRHFFEVTSGTLISKRHPVQLLIVPRVMRCYRSVLRDVGERSKFPDLSHWSRKPRAVLKLLWFISFLLPPQRNFFPSLRMAAWGRHYCPPDDPASVTPSTASYP